MTFPFCLEIWENAWVWWSPGKNLLYQVHFHPVVEFSEYSTQWISSQIFFEDGGAGLYSVKSTCAGDDIVAAASGCGSVSADVGCWNGYESVAAAATGDGIVSTTAKGYGSVSVTAGDGIVAADARDGSEVGYMGVSGGLGTGEDVFLRLYPLFLNFYT